MRNLLLLSASLTWMLFTQAPAWGHASGGNHTHSTSMGDSSSGFGSGGSSFGGGSFGGFNGPPGGFMGQAPAAPPPPPPPPPPKLSEAGKVSGTGFGVRSKAHELGSPHSRGGETTVHRSRNTSGIYEGETSAPTEIIRLRERGKYLEFVR